MYLPLPGIPSAVWYLCNRHTTIDTVGSVWEYVSDLWYIEANHFGLKIVCLWFMSQHKNNQGQGMGSSDCHYFVTVMLFPH